MSEPGLSSGDEGSVENVVLQAAEAVGNILLNATDLGINGTNETEKFKASTEGLAIAYASLVFMALIPIVIGSFKSISHQSQQKESGENIETMSTKEAMLFPVIASVTLFGIYIVFQVNNHYSYDQDQGIS